MKYIIVLLSFLPELVSGQQKTNTQNKPNSLATFLMFNWEVIHAVNIDNPEDTVYNRAKKIKKWSVGDDAIYRLGNKQLGFVGADDRVEIGIADSVTENRFIARITYANGQECVYEYDNVALVKGNLTYRFRKWNFVDNDSRVRILQYGYNGFCYKTKEPHHRPTLAEIEKKRGNKISYVFSNDDGKPIANAEVTITVPQNSIHFITSVYTNKNGEANGYYRDSDFSSTGHITLLMEYQGLKSSAVVEKKYCPIVIKRVLTSKDEGSEDVKISIGPE
jgi:hypothetical protein